MAHGRTKVPEIRRGDTVIVLAGKDAGKRGTVERVITNATSLERVAPTGRAGASRRAGFWKPASAHPVSVVVEGVNVAKRHTKPRQTSSATDRMPRVQQGGILDIAQPLPISRVMLVCPKCDRPTRIAHATLENGRRVRVCRHCGEALEVAPS